jgi:copper(I)-binding protein
MRILFALFALLAPSVAFAQVTIDMPWARATAPKAMVGGAFMTITSIAADRVTRVESPVASTAELHQTVEEAGVMKMKPVPALVLVAGKSVTLKPGGYHVMLMGLTAPLKQGEHFPITLYFATSPPVTVEVQIAAPGAAGPALRTN